MSARAALKTPSANAASPAPPNRRTAAALSSESSSVVNDSLSESRSGRSSPVALLFAHCVGSNHCGPLEAVR